MRYNNILCLAFLECKLENENIQMNHFTLYKGFPTQVEYHTNRTLRTKAQYENIALESQLTMICGILACFQFINIKSMSLSLLS